MAGASASVLPMITIPPLFSCPVCNYSFRGLPSAGCCPECGFQYDEHTVVLRPRKPWKTYIGMFAIEAGLIYLLGPPFLTLLTLVCGVVVSALLSVSLALAILVATGIVVFQANRRSRFAAVTPMGVVIRNLGAKKHIAFEEIALFAARDAVPWIKQRNSDEIISLRGLYDAREELSVFGNALSQAMSGAQNAQELGAVASNAIKTASSENIERCYSVPAGPMRKLERRSWVAIMAMIGIGLIVTGIAVGIIASVFPRSSTLDMVSNVGVGLFWAGALVALIGQWYSDPRPSRKRK